MPIKVLEQSTSASFSTEKKRHSRTSLYPIDRNTNLDLHRFNTCNTLNYEQASNKFSVYKTNGSKKLSEHLKQQKYLTKRKFFVHCENEFTEKKNFEISDKRTHNNSQPDMLHMVQATVQDSNTNNEDILNLAQNGISNSPKNCISTILLGSKKDSYNQTSFAETNEEPLKDTYNEDRMQCYAPKSNEDGNNNSLNTADIALLPNNNSVDGNKNISNNCYKPSRNAVVTNNERIQNDDNNNASNDLNYDFKTDLKKQADNNNNVFLEAPSNIEAKKDERTKEMKLKPYSNLC